MTETVSDVTNGLTIATHVLSGPAAINSFTLLEFVTTYPSVAESQDLRDTGSSREFQVDLDFIRQAENIFESFH